VTSSTNPAIRAVGVAVSVEPFERVEQIPEPELRPELRERLWPGDPVEAELVAECEHGAVHQDPCRIAGLPPPRDTIGAVSWSGLVGSPPSGRSRPADVAWLVERDGTRFESARRLH